MKQRRLLRPVFCLLLVLILLCTPACKAPATQNGTTGNTESSGGAQITDGFVPVLRFVVTSDVHIRGENNNLQSYELLASFISTAYGYSDAHPHYQKLDGMFFVGDVTNSGTKAQLSYFFNYVKENVREGTVARAVMGNHEYYASGNFNATSMKEAPEDFLEASGYEAVDTHITLGGYHFIFLSTDLYNKSSSMFFSSDKLLWLRQQLDAAKADTPDKPIFVFQHEPPRDTMVGSGSASSDQLLTRLLKEYPQVIDFSGHTHVSTTHPQIIWQGGFTAINTGSLAYLSIPIYDENGKMIRPKQVDETGAYETDSYENGPRNAGMYYIVEIDANSVVRIQRFDMFTNKVWGEPFILDSIDPADFKYTDARKEQAVAPVFDASAAITVESADSENPLISFPQATCKDLVANYRIEIYQGDTLVKTQLRMAETFYGDATPTVLNTHLGKMDPGEYTLKVYATSSWALHSEPITGTLTVN